MNIFHCSITRSSTLMFNVIFRNYKFPPFEHKHFTSLPKINNKIQIPDNNIIHHVTRIKYTDFFDTFDIKTNKIKGFYMARDPREVIISAYYSWLYSHPGGHGEREKIKNMSKNDALIYIIDHYETEFNVMYDWLTKCNDERFKIIKFENFYQTEEKQYKNMIELFKFLELTNDEDYIRKITDKNTFSYLGGRKAGIINNKHHYRSGTSDTWKTELPDKVLNYLYNKKGENFITDMGYEK